MAKRELNGSVAIVTGASSGIGWQSAIDFAEKGVRLCVTARREKPLQLLKEEIEKRGGECLVITGDVSQPEDIDRVVSECVKHYGRIDTLLNNASVQVYGKFEDYEWRDIEQIFKVNCFGYLRFARAVLPHFRRQKSGHIVNVLSVLATGSLQLFSIYAATKAAIFGWAKCLGLELSGTDIHVSNILMPAVATPLYDHALNKTGRAHKPLPPIYDTRMAARSVLKVARKPKEEYIPVFWQGKLLLASKDWAPPIRRWVLRKWGMRWQDRNYLKDPNHGNLYHPVPEGFGPKGSLEPTAKWKRFAPAMVLAGAIGFRLAHFLRHDQTTFRKSKDGWKEHHKKGIRRAGSASIRPHEA